MCYTSDRIILVRMVVQTLGKILGSDARVKVMRLFLLNASTPFIVDDVKRRCEITKAKAEKELVTLHEAGFLKTKTFTRSITLSPKKAGGKSNKRGSKVSREKVVGYVLDTKFKLVEELRALLVEAGLITTKELPNRLKSAGKIKALILSGIFLKDDESHVDMLVVGEKLDMGKLSGTMRTIESEIGKEIRYTVFEPNEFQYRMDMYDKHILDIFDRPHERLVDKVGLPKGKGARS